MIFWNLKYYYIATIFCMIFYGLYLFHSLYCDNETSNEFFLCCVKIERRVANGQVSNASPLAGKLFVLVGAGGAGRAIAFGARSRGARLVIFNRSFGKILSQISTKGCIVGLFFKIFLTVICPPFPFSKRESKSSCQGSIRWSSTIRILKRILPWERDDSCKCFGCGYGA